MPDGLTSDRQHAVPSPWATRAGETFEPANWEECLARFLSDGDTLVWYRGHRSYDWGLRTTLERSLRKAADLDGPVPASFLDSAVQDDQVDGWFCRWEQVLLHRFQDLAEEFELPALPPAEDRLAWWEIMQHHGAPTRLLDWSRSPFVALWFAIEEPGDGDAAVWVLDTRNCHLNLGATRSIVNVASDVDVISGREWQNRFVTAAIERRDSVPVPVTSLSGFRRSAAQQGVLTVMANLPTPASVADAIRASLATRVRIRAEWRPEIAATCRSMGLSRLRLFRDLDTLGAALRDGLEQGDDPLLL